MSINGTLAFVILWIVNALIALVYLLVGIFLYVPACYGRGRAKIFKLS